jgi:hypothetical protein
MSYFLWIEDFENNAKVTTENVFGSVLDDRLFDEKPFALKKNLEPEGVFIKLDLQEGLNFISRDLLSNIDFVILDIDLVAHDGEINDELLSLIKTYEDYQPSEEETEDDELRNIACTKLKPIAGFYLYTKLVFEIGFPKSHILFCSNHGENTESIQKAFHTARIALPIIYKKSDEYVNHWVKSNYENPYSRLRRGIIEGCRFLIDMPLRFDKFSTNDKNPVNLDLENYLAILSGFFSLNKPEKSTTAYKLFIRTLAHEWDEAVKPRKLDKDQVSLAFSWIMKMTRNWSAHTTVFELISEQDVAFLFLVNMRAMFDLGAQLAPYERYLLMLFEQPLNHEDFKQQCGGDFKTRQIPLTQKYAVMLSKYGTNFEAINFHDLLNELQKKQAQSNQFLIEGLYQVFWFLTSFGRVYIDPHKVQEQKYLNYQFNYFDYSSQEYLTEIGRHIYRRSFPEA